MCILTSEDVGYCGALARVREFVLMVQGDGGRRESKGPGKCNMQVLSVHKKAIYLTFYIVSL